MLKQLFIGFILVFISTTTFGQLSVGGTMMSADTAKCVSGNSGSIQLTGYTGNILRWEYSYSGNDPWTPISHTSATYNYTNLSQSISFRAIVQVPSNLPATSSVIRVNVYQTSLGGAITGNTTVCSGITEQYNLLNSRGSILNWEQSINAGSTWTLVSLSTDSLTLNRSFTQNTLYRVNVDNGACPTAQSAVLSIGVSAPSVSGTISGTDSVCQSGNTVNLNLSGSTANQYTWQTALQINGPWTNLGTNSTSLTTTNIGTTSFYRVVAQNGGCAAAISSTHTVTVSSPSTGGSLAGQAVICEADSAGLTLVNYNGTILQWEESANNGGSWSPIAFNGDTYTSGALTANMLYRVLVKNGVCTSTYSNPKTITVNAKPNTDFSVTNGCEDATLVFSNLTPGTNTYSWNHGDGSGSTVTNSAHSYAAPGTFLVSLFATNVAGCSDSISHTVTVYPRPTADFDFTDTVCLNDSIPFTDLSSLSGGTIVNYAWDFGGLGTSTSQNPTFSQLIAGTNLVSFKVTSSFGCVDSITKPVVIHDKPIAGFTVQSACFGTAVNFQNTSYTGGANPTYFWDFGDATTSASVNPAHNYATTGTFNTLLIVSNNYQCADTLIQPVSVNPMPQVTFTSTDVCFSDSMAFTPTVSGVTNYTYQWNFGDGTNATVANPMHYYTNYGTYQTQLTIQSDSGCVTSVSQNVNVFPLPSAVFSVQNECQLNDVQFLNFSSIPLGTISNAWDFGNGNNSAVFSPVEVYAAAGVYPLELIVTSDHGCVDTATSTITIFDRPIAAFGFNNVCYGVPIAFTNGSTVTFGSISSVVWDFGDNTNSTLMTPTKEYLNSGTYTVELIVESSNGCGDTIQQSISVYDAPIADFDVLSACFGDATTFNNTTTLGAGAFTSVWNFGDGNNSTAFAPAYTYGSAGIFTADLIITSDFGCKDSISKPVIIYQLPAVNAGEDTTIDKGYQVPLTAVGGVSYTWLPSTGLSTATEATTWANPSETTEYSVTIVDVHGCFGYDTVTVFVENTFKIKPFNILTPDENGKNDTWIIENIESYPDNSVAIYNELGHEVFTGSSYLNTWDGRNKTGEILPDGTYYYIISFSDTDKKYQGDVLLIRNKN
jgi:gliding motility-associated-like protein